MSSHSSFAIVTVPAAHSCLLPYLCPSAEKVLPFPPSLITYPLRAERIPLPPLPPYLCRCRWRGRPKRAPSARERVRPLLRACARPNFVDGTAEGRTNFSLKYHRRSTALPPSSILSAVSPLSQFGRCLSGDVMLCDVLCFRPAHGDGAFSF